MMHWIFCPQPTTYFFATCHGVFIKLLLVGQMPYKPRCGLCLGDGTCYTTNAAALLSISLTIILREFTGFWKGPVTFCLRFVCYSHSPGGTSNCWWDGWDEFELIFSYSVPSLKTQLMATVPLQWQNLWTIISPDSWNVGVQQRAL